MLAREPSHGEEMSEMSEEKIDVGSKSRISEKMSTKRSTSVKMEPESSSKSSIEFETENVCLLDVFSRLGIYLAESSWKHQNLRSHQNSILNRGSFCIRCSRSFRCHLRLNTCAFLGYRTRCARAWHMALQRLSHSESWPSTSAGGTTTTQKHCRQGAATFSRIFPSEKSGSMKECQKKEMSRW